MAPESRPKTNPVIQNALEQQLRSEPWTFDFFQAMRLLMLMQPDRHAVGEFWPPRSEAVRLGTYPSLSFPASQIQALTWSVGTQPFLQVNFMGLVGTLGVLPVPYTELVLERRRLRDTRGRSSGRAVGRKNLCPQRVRKGLLSEGHELRALVDN